MASPLVVGLDLGTTGTRAVAFDLEGQVVADASAEYPLSNPRSGWVEQDAEAVFGAAVSCLRGVVAGASAARIVAIGMSGAMHNVLPVGDDGRALAPAMIWADTRAAEDAAAIRAAVDADALYHRTGCPVHPMYLPAKLRWLARADPDLFRRARRFATLKDFVFERLTGAACCDLSAASGTGLLDLRRKGWDEVALDVGRVSADRLGRLVEPTTHAPLGADAAAATGLAAGLPVVIGASDGVLSSLGTGSIAPGQMTVMIGTSGAVRIVVDRPTTDPRARTWCYYLARDRWVAGAAINNAGIVRWWAEEKLLGRRGAAADDESVTRWAAEVGPGAGGLVFLPFLTGERAPFWNADARGVLFGLAIDHDHRHVARATLEGVCYRMKSVYDALEEVAGPTREIRASGGFVRSDLWLRMLCDVLGRPLHVPTLREASALGAAFVAMLALGHAVDLADIGRFVAIRDRVDPDPANHAAYARVYDLYIRLYHKLGPEFAEIARAQRAAPS